MKKIYFQTKWTKNINLSTILITTMFFICLFVCFLSSRFADTLEQADDMAIDIPHIWLYLAELLSPVLREGGFSMRELFRY